jgi:glycosyltransferase involved in cell wall biosynthesis
MLNQKGVSVIICCYNSSLRLPETLKHIANQDVTDLRWEVIIVNNNSSDKTVEVAKEEWARHQFEVPFLVVDEPEQGLSKARRKGVEVSNFEYLVFCDDDNWLSPDYIHNAAKILNSNPSIGVAVGNIQAVTEVDPPYWFNSYSGWYACGSQSYKDGDLSERSYVWGAGMVLRKMIYTKILELNISSVLPGRSGTSLSSGEDSEISKWALLLGYKLWFSELLQLKHFIPKERVSLSYLEKLISGNKISDYWLDKYNILIQIKKSNYTSGRLLTKGFVLLLSSLIGNSEYKRTYAQFMIGSLIRISSKDNYYLTCKFHSFLSK